MKLTTLVFLYISFGGLIGIQFASIIDNPQHLMEPDPNCPICLIVKTEVSSTPRLSIGFTPDIILYLVEKAPRDQKIKNYFPIITIRAPPFS